MGRGVEGRHYSSQRNKENTAFIRHEQNGNVDKNNI